MKSTPHFYFEQLKPVLEDVGRLIAQSQLTPMHRAGLAVSVLTFQAATVRAAFREAGEPITPQQIAKLIELALEPE